MEKQWIAIPTWEDRQDVKLRDWNSIVKYHKYKGEKHLENWQLYPHFQCSGWWTHSQKKIPFKDGSKIIITVLWNLTPEKGWLSQYAFTVEYQKENYFTYIDPVTADRIIHGEYFPCFTDQAIRKALFGERLVACYFPWGHRGQVGTLQFLALQAYLRGRKHGREGTRGARRSRRGRTGAMAGNVTGENQPGGPVTLPPRVPFPSLEHMCRTLA
ncbi:vif protein [Simian immunodeficiency virus]|uniref:Virion infectivity factor n=1 Tax=Simian immunodeficiency virus TaxID=11723 RepID=Q7ZB18_SIV|nr:vif protein [Simian immunodeficiency virus]